MYVGRLIPTHGSEFHFMYHFVFIFASNLEYGNLTISKHPHEKI
jgi:hypothetical protein